MAKMVFIDDTILLEPYGDITENFLYWLKNFMNSKFITYSKRKVLDYELLDTQRKQFETCESKDLEDFAAIIRAMGRNGFKSPKAHFNPLKKFHEFLIETEQDDLKSINNKMIEYYIVNRLSDYARTTSGNHLVAIKAFLGHIEKNNQLNEDNTEAHSFKLKNDLYKLLGKKSNKVSHLNPFAEYYLFLESISSNNWNTDNVARNTLMLKMLMITGVRVGELTAIKITDIKKYDNEDTLEFDIVGKGDVARKVNVSYSLVRDEYEECVRKSEEIGSEYLFSTTTGNAVNDRYLNTIVEQILIIAGIQGIDKKGPHMLRHSAATWLHAVAGYDILMLQHYLGHRDIRQLENIRMLNMKQ